MRRRYCTGALVLTIAFSLPSAVRPLYPPAHTAANGNPLLFKRSPRLGGEKGATPP